MLKDLKGGKVVTDDRMLELLGLAGNAGSLKIIDALKGFPDETKSAAFLGTSLKTALRCPICKGYLDSTKAVSYDHMTPKRDGGRGDVDNIQLAHPFCNTGVKC